MKYYGEEQIVKVVEERQRPLEYIRCDICNKKIIPNGYRDRTNEYIRVHTWHNDWGNDSCDSHETQELCIECATKFVSEYVRDISGTQQLELELCYLGKHEKFKGKFSYWDGCRLVENDRLAHHPTEKGGSHE
jgi:hypothetical protein